MATEVSYNGDGNDKTFDITFPFLLDTHVKVQVGGQTKSTPADYSISGTEVTFVTAPVSGTANVRLYRDTPFTALHDYSAGSSIKSNALNENQTQALYAIEEAKLVTVTAGGITTGSKNDITVNSNSDWVINSSAITNGMIADEAINSAKIENSSILNTDIADDTIRDGKIATNTIALDKLARVGTSGQILTSNGTGAAPSYQATVNVPVGSVIWYAGSTAPAGYLKANGDAIANGSGTTQSITANFAALYAIVGANLPDLRGEFVRGWDDGKGTDSGRAIRSTQAEAYKEHNHPSDVSIAHDVDDPGHSHNFTLNPSDSDSNTIPTMGDSGTQTTGSTASNTTGIDIDIAATVDVNNSGSTETRPRNVALLACIKY